MHPDFLLEVANASEKAEALSTGFGVTDPQHGGDFLEGGRQLLHFLHEISL